LRDSGRRKKGDLHPGIHAETIARKTGREDSKSSGRIPKVDRETLQVVRKIPVRTCRHGAKSEAKPIADKKSEAWRRPPGNAHAHQNKSQPHHRTSGDEMSLTENRIFTP
jgi:hypothetical protein